MKTWTLVFIVIVGFAVTGCFLDRDRDRAQIPRPQADPRPQVTGGAGKTCETAEDEMVDTSNPVDKQELTVKTYSQWYSHVDCNKKPISGDWVKVVNDNSDIEISSQLLKSNQRVKEIDAYNRSTCSTLNTNGSISDVILFPFTILGEALAETLNGGKPHTMKLTVGLKQRSDNNLVVRVGQNVIDYKFLGKCLNDDGKNDTNECKRSEREILEQGTLVLNVAHDVQNLPDIKEIDDCKPAPQASVQGLPANADGEIGRDTKRTLER